MTRKAMTDMNTRTLEATIASINPCPASGHAVSMAPDAADEVLWRLEHAPTAASTLSRPRTDVTRPWRRRAGFATVLTAGFGALVLVVVGLPSHGGRATAAATPPLIRFSGTAKSAAQVLRAAAASAKQQSAPTSEPYTYLKSAGWGLLTTQGAPNTSGFEPTATEMWWNPAGAARVITWKGPAAPAGTVPPPVDTSAAGDIQDFGTGQYEGLFDFNALSNDPDTLRTELLAMRPTTDVDPTPANAYLWTQGTKALMQTPPPAIRAALLEVLADVPGATALGDGRDYAGTQGTGVALDSDSSGLPIRYEVIVDPTTGEYIASDEVLQSPGSLNVAVPSVIAYDETLAEGHVAELGQQR
jgi:hypothetical protein